MRQKPERDDCAKCQGTEFYVRWGFRYGKWRLRVTCAACERDRIRGIKREKRNTTVVIDGREFTYKQAEQYREAIRRGRVYNPKVPKLWDSTVIILNSFICERNKAARFDEQNHWGAHKFYVSWRASKATLEKYYSASPEDRKELNRLAYWKHKEKRKLSAKVWRLNNKLRVKKTLAAWFKTEKGKAAIRRERKKPQAKLARNLRRRLRDFMKRGEHKESSRVLFGCTFQELREHIESLWQTGMSWDNYGLYGWHVDHITPCAAFNLSEPSQRLACCHFSNLQPLWWRDNLDKADSLIYDKTI